MSVSESTHWQGCWRVHHECAVALIERLLVDAGARPIGTPHASSTKEARGAGTQ